MIYFRSMKSVLKHESIGAVVIVVHPESQKILLGKRKNSYKAGYFGLPGGRVDYDELLPTGAARELLEETGLVSQDLSYLGVVREQQESSQFIHFGFVTHDFQGVPTNVEPDKCEGWEWYDLESLPSPILPGHKGIIDIFRSPEKENVRDVLLEPQL